MTIAYFDCFSGISGDMTLGALVDCGADAALLDAVVEALRLGDEVTVEVRHETRGHVGGTRVIVSVDDRVERTVPALRSVIEESGAPADVKSPALDAINRLARAEGRVHGRPPGLLRDQDLARRVRIAGSGDVLGHMNPLGSASGELIPRPAWPGSWARGVLCRTACRADECRRHIDVRR